MTKIKSICIDTLTAIQERQYAADKKKPGHDQWFDYGVTIANFVNELSNLGFEIVLVLGEPGTGKSSGMRTLDPGTNIWYNADKKNPTWIGGREEYGKKFKPTPRLHQLPDTYADIINHIKAGIEADKFKAKAAKEKKEPMPDSFTIRKNLIEQQMQQSGSKNAPKSDLLKAADAIVGAK